MQPATNLDDLRRRAAKFMQLEELREFRNNAEPRQEGKRRRIESGKEGPEPVGTRKGTIVAPASPATHL